MNFLSLKKECGGSLYVLFMFFVLFLVQSMEAQTYNSDRVTIQVQKQPVEKVFKEITKQTGLKFFYGETAVDNKLSVSINLKKVSVQTVLNEITKQVHLYFIKEDNTISVSNRNSSTRNSSSDKNKVKGRVVDEKGEPIIGANVVEKGTSNGVVTDLDGQFGLSISAGASLTISYIGYVEQQIEVKPGVTSYKVVMDENSQSLEEVVVVGYGVQKKKLLTGATVQVKGDDIQKLNTISALGALQSQTPGVNITQSSGLPGEGFKVVVRGLGTIGSSGPLYIIDGVPGGNINDLNPADIESIDVLKDAASAAIYGARAANGVILITTKQGHAGKVSISYDGYFGVQNVYKMAPLLNAQEYAMIMNEGRMMDGAHPYDFSSMVPNWDKIESGEWKGTNWLDESRNKDAPTQNHAINIIGGTDRSVYSVGFAYTSQEGIIGKPVAREYDRYTFRLNTEHILIKYKDLDILKFGENMNYAYKEYSGADGIDDIYWNDIHNLLTGCPFMPLYGANNDYYGTADFRVDNYSWDTATPNPIGLMYYTRGHNLSKNHDMRLNAYLEIQPIRNLKLRSSFGLITSHSSYRSFSPVFDLAPSSTNKENSVSQSMSTGLGWTWENTLNYSFKIRQNHNFDILVGQSMERSGLGESLNASNPNSIFDDFNHAYIGNTQPSSSRTGIGGSPWGIGGLASFFGRINYNYKETYMATVVMRADGSSNFARGHRWGYFPSVSAGWVMSNEAFMESTKSWMDFFKIRASWGQNGNADIAGFQYLATISFAGAGYPFGTDKTSPSVGAFPDILPNKDVTWETSEQLDLGFDTRFLGNRLGVSFDWYNKMTKDWLVQAPVLASYGTGAPYINGGDVRNRGFELALNWNDHIQDFTYGVNLNLSHNKNKVTRIANSEGIIHGASDVLSSGASEMYRAQVGFPIGYFYGYKTLGIFQNEEQIVNYRGAKLADTRPGDVIFEDVDKNGEIDENDRCEIGNPHPDFNLGFSLNFGWKGFDLSITTSGAFGQQIAKSYRSFIDRPKENYTTDILGRWHGEGTSNKLPRLTSGIHANWQYISDIYIEDGDYLKIQNQTIGYDFKKLFPRIPLSQARLYFTAQNLYTFTGYSGMDPEIGYGADQSWVSGIDLGFYPSPRTYMVGVNLKF